MELSQGVIRPGIVRKVEEGNIIKASVPGLFSAEDPPEKLPPIRLFTSNFPNSITCVKELDEVWVLSFNDNPAELYWMRKDDQADAQINRDSLDDVKDKKIKPGKSAEVIFNKNDGGSQTALYASQESGTVLKKDDAYVQLDADGNINMGIGYPARDIKISKECIVIGAGSSAGKPQPTVLGDNLEKVLNDVVEALATIQGAAKKNPYTMQIALCLEPCILKLQNEANSILSSNVKIS